MPKRSNLVGRYRVHVGTEKIEESIELNAMHIVSLRIDVPDKRPRRPLGAHEGIFASHKINITGPEQSVIAFVIEKGNDPRAEIAGDVGLVDVY